jgi:hypothetical protein
MYAPSYVQRFVTGLWYVLAINGDHSDHADLSVLEQRLTYLASMRREYGLDETCWSTVHCALHANPLSYKTPLRDGVGTATAADLAILWREHLHQGLYVPTTGSHGAPEGQRALRAFASAPRLVSQIRLTISPTDPPWDTSVDDLADDLRVLDPLWDLPAALPDTDTTRFHLAVQAAPEDMADAREAVVDLLRASGMSRVRLYSAFNDPRLISFQSIVRSGNRMSAGMRQDEDPVGSDDPLRTCFGIDTTGVLFSIATTDDSPDTSLAKITSMPYSWDDLRRAAIRAGWVA